MMVDDKLPLYKRVNSPGWLYRNNFITLRERAQVICSWLCRRMDKTNFQYGEPLKNSWTGRSAKVIAQIFDKNPV